MVLLGGSRGVWYDTTGRAVRVGWKSHSSEVLHACLHTQCGPCQRDLLHLEGAHGLTSVAGLAARRRRAAEVGLTSVAGWTLGKGRGGP